MPAYSFQAQFIPAIESGLKTHTIRGERRHRPCVGQTFYGYYAMRTRQCRKLFESPITKVGNVVLTDSGRKLTGFDVYPQIEIDGIRLAHDEMESLARRDGFNSLHHMSCFWDLNTTFHGDIIYWKPFVTAPATLAKGQVRP